MAYDFLKSTTYSNDPLAQGDFDQFIPQSTPLGSGFDNVSFDSDLIEMVVSDEEAQSSTDPNLVEMPTVEEEPEQDPQVDMEILNMIFQEEPEAAPRQKAYTPPPPTIEDEEEAEPASTPIRTGKVKPRIWQYGGSVLGEPAQTGIGDVYTPLPKGPKFTQQQEVDYQKWRNRLPKRLQYEGNYNLRQFWYDTPNTPISPNMHFPDFYKMPNHPSFSSHSQYMTPTNRYLGGQWKETDSSWDYTPYNDYVKPYIHEKKMQTGGNTLYADTYEQQRIGLNNPNYNTAVFSTKGTNTFRGLDSYEPVAVTDGSKYKVLYGPQDTAKFSGKVYEQKLKMQTGGSTRKPIYTSDTNDPRIKAYNDSLKLYNKSLEYTKGFKDIHNVDSKMGIENYIKSGQDDLGNKVHPTIKPVGLKRSTRPSDDEDVITYFYKKPVQPIQYKESEPLTRYTIDPYDPRISDYNNKLSLYRNDKNIYEKETGLSYDELLKSQGDSNVTYTESGKAIHFNRKPSEQFVYKDIKPSNVQEVRAYNSDINIQVPSYKPTDLSQKPTKYSATYRDGNQQKTIYFKDKNTWKSFLDTGALSNVDTSETENRASATGYRSLQFGGELRPETNEIKEFYNQYGNSPNYTKRLVEQGYTNPQQVILDRIANIKPVITSVDNLIGSQYNAPNYTVFYNPKDAAEYGFPKQSTLAHEYGHTFGASQGKYLTNPNLELNKNEMNAFSSRNKLRIANTAGMTEQQKLDLEHDSRPSESKADLDALRFRLFKDKIYDTGTQEFNPELLKKAKELYKDDNIVNRLFQNYSDDDLIYLMNHVAKNDSKETTVAQTGAEIADVKQFYKNYYNSPNYAARRKNTSGTGTPTENLNRLLKSKIVPSNKGSYEKNGKIGIDKKDLMTYNTDMGTLLSHEYSHPNPLNATEKDLINTRNNLFDFPSKFTSGQVPINDQSLRNLHDSQAHEFKADMDALRYNLYKDKIYNTGTQQFDQKTLEKAKELYKKNGFMDRLFKRVKDKDLIYLMNTIAQNDNNTQSEIYG